MTQQESNLDTEINTLINKEHENNNRNNEIDNIKQEIMHQESEIEQQIKQLKIKQISLKSKRKQLENEQSQIQIENKQFQQQIYELILNKKQLEMKQKMCEINEYKSNENDDQKIDNTNLFSDYLDNGIEELTFFVLDLENINNIQQKTNEFASNIDSIDITDFIDNKNEIQNASDFRHHSFYEFIYLIRDIFCLIPFLIIVVTLFRLPMLILTIISKLRTPRTSINDIIHFDIEEASLEFQEKGKPRIWINKATKNMNFGLNNAKEGFLRLFVLGDEFWNDISSKYCPDGNDCGKCYNIVKANASENFMIPFMEFKKQYYILVHSFIIGSYQIDTGQIVSYQSNQSLYKGYALCGDTISGQNTDYSYTSTMYYINVNNSYKIDSEFCKQGYNELMIWYYNEATYLASSLCVGCGTCTRNDSPQQVRLPIIEYTKQYLLLIFGTGIVTAKINCFPVTSGSEYEIIPFTDKLTVKQAEFACEMILGTSLATIITSDDLINASKKLYSIQQNEVNMTAWIGLYKDTLKTERNWMDGTPCNLLTEQYECPYYSHLAMDSEQVLFEQKQTGTILTFEEGKHVFKDIPANEASSQSVLCNARTGNYPAPVGCTEQVNCWGFLFKASYSQPPSNEILIHAFWNKTYFEIRINDQNLTIINITANQQIIWYHYSDNAAPKTITKRATQYKSGLYIPYSYVNEGGNVTVFEMLHITLDPIHAQKVPIFSYRSLTHCDLCVVADDKHVYVLGLKVMLINDMNAGEWSQPIVTQTDVVSACVMDSDSKFIYIFGYQEYVLYKYDITLKAFIFLSELNLCSMRIGHGITAPNGKAYLHGCYITSWKTLIFNMDTNTFEGTADINI
eukprot:172266_1